jgi:ATP-dependent Lon protease
MSKKSIDYESDDSSPLIIHSRKRRKINKLSENEITKRSTLFFEDFYDKKNNDDSDISDITTDKDYTEIDDTITSPKKRLESWTKSMTSKELYKLTEEETVEYNDRFEKVTNILAKKDITTKTILELSNITDDERSELMEKLLILMELEETDFREYISYRNELIKQIHSYQKNNIDIETRNKIQEIKNRLEKYNYTDIDIEQKILTLQVEDDYYIKYIYDKYKMLKDMNPSDNEYYKLKEWVENVVSVPFDGIKMLKIHENNSYKNPDLLAGYLKHVMDTLDKHLYGMNKSKEELLFMLNHKIKNPDSQHNILALVGPPGTGKTALILALCEALELPSFQISLGGENDASSLKGHSYTYEGARPGQIVTALQKMKCKNGIIYLDEFDKLQKSEHSKEVMGALLHILDFTQNKKFRDRYLPELPIDLSNIWFILSLNDIDHIDPVLRNRIEFIMVNDYTIDEKQEIVKNYLIPKISKEFNFSKTDFTIDDIIITHLINITEKKEGIRDLERNIRSIFRKLDMLKTIHASTKHIFKLSFDVKHFKIPVTITAKIIDVLLK